MPLPFPGMNPFLEHPDVWHDFHQRFVTRLGDAIGMQIRPKYITKIDENVYIHELSAEERYLLGRPDVAVLAGNVTAGAQRSNATIEPMALGQILPATDRISEPFIEIRDRESRELITVVELLSPTNKDSGSDREQYLGKRRRILASHVHLVEIDLLRGGARMPVEGLAQTDYAIVVSRYQKRPQVDLWPIRLRERLPKIPIPLRYGDREAAIDLQVLLSDQYDAAGYEDYIYDRQPRPPLHPDDLAWANTCRG